MPGNSASQVRVSDLIVLDTSIFIDHLRTSRHTERLDNLTGLIRNSAVVLAELWRGATKPVERQFLKALEKSHPILTPTETNWLESGQILSRILSEEGLTPNKLRDLHFDVLIALTARSHGARVITSNRADFGLIHKYRKFQLEVW
jgi:predicted nucleic acid-binding protein